ncbi:carboxymuconolactone decarboxylase family protein [Bradyrhizobium sp.]|jgi:AhpD family alkylhydroperoxidase|uniref:carboxymuconolactone decarboxylase family protein n=1 Tax=Bradyrhizobium sp. TaxID=376 RepID=UPI002BA7DDE4|nr:carboxymuconolactone decarboxylase family protein [Bradyrhizobium sp.]HWX57149.1 carboxymuconolactone decarboxylase family protein [Bradyrhizobium sp.]
MSYEQISNDVRKEALDLYKAVPEVMRSFQGLMGAVSKEGALPVKTKELMALAIAISSKCEGCLVFHVQNAIKHGASREEVAETIAVSIEMGGGPSTVYGAKALAAFDELKGKAK